MKRLMKALLLVFGFTVWTTPVHAGIPVIDLTNIMQSVMNTADQLRYWTQQIKTAREQYAMVTAVAAGLKDWRNMQWSDTLQVFEMPWFDGISGIEDIRNLAAAGGMGLDELQSFFNETNKVQRMMNSPMYRENQLYAAKVRMWSICYTRVVRRRMALVKMHQQYLDDMNRLRAQQRTLQTLLEAETNKEPPSQAVILSLQAKIALISAKMSGDKDAIQSQEEIIKQQEAQEIEDTNEKVGRLDDSANSPSTSIQTPSGNR